MLTRTRPSFRLDSYEEPREEPGEEPGEEPREELPRIGAEEAAHVSIAVPVSVAAPRVGPVSARGRRRHSDGRGERDGDGRAVADGASRHDPSEIRCVDAP